MRSFFFFYLVAIMDSRSQHVEIDIAFEKVGPGFHVPVDRRASYLLNVVGFGCVP